MLSEAAVLHRIMRVTGTADYSALI
jgi:hypothetical protein